MSVAHQGVCLWLNSEVFEENPNYEEQTSHLPPMLSQSGSAWWKVSQFTLLSCYVGLGDWHPWLPAFGNSKLTSPQLGM